MNLFFGGKIFGIFDCGLMLLIYRYIKDITIYWNTFIINYNNIIYIINLIYYNKIELDYNYIIF